MFARWRLGKLLGFPIDVKASFLALLLVVFLAFGGLVGLLGIAIAFSSVILHELGHAVVARRRGVRIENIELGFFGGAARMTSQPHTANDEIAIAVAGPAVSVALALGTFGMAFLLQSPLLALIGWINLVIAGFNLLPALPMDGGRILRALLTRWYGFVRATEVAVTTSRGFAIAFAAYGVMIGSFQLILLAPLLWVLGTREKWLARMTAHHYAYSPQGYVYRADEPYVDFVDVDDGNDLGGFDHRFGSASHHQDRNHSAEPFFRVRRVGNRFVIETLR